MRVFLGPGDWSGDQLMVHRGVGTQQPTTQQLQPQLAATQDPRIHTSSVVKELRTLVMTLRTFLTTSCNVRGNLH